MLYCVQCSLAKLLECKPSNVLLGATSQTFFISIG